MDKGHQTTSHLLRAPHSLIHSNINKATNMSSQAENVVASWLDRGQEVSRRDFHLAVSTARKIKWFNWYHWYQWTSRNCVLLFSLLCLQASNGFGTIWVTHFEPMINPVDWHIYRRHCPSEFVLRGSANRGRRRPAWLGSLWKFAHDRDRYLTTLQHDKMIQKTSKDPPFLAHERPADASLEGIPL